MKNYLFAAFCLSALILAGCGGKAKTTSSSSDQSTTESSDSHTHFDGSGDPVNVDIVGYCTQCGQYTGIDVLSENFNHELELVNYGYENTHDIFIRFVPREGKEYYLIANHSFDYRQITCTLYGRDNDVYSSTGLTEMCVMEEGDIGGWAVNYYSELASFAKGDDNYLYLHLVTKTGDENKVQAGDSFWINEINA